MGAYSSWAMLALSHHVIVHIASQKAGVPFDTVLYRVLGDDVVINNDKVSLAYVELMAALGISISMGKSVISKRFTEFAKRLRGPNVDFSPIGAGAILAACRSGYLFPALFRASLGNVINSVQDVLALVDKIPSGLISRRDLTKFCSLVLWQMFGPSQGMRQVTPAHMSAFAVQWVSGLPQTVNLISHILDSVLNIRMKRFRQTVAESYIPMRDLIIGSFTITVSTTPFLRVLETLMLPFNPGWWLYFVEAIDAPNKMWEETMELYKNQPMGADPHSLAEDKHRLFYYCKHFKETQIATVPLTKSEAQMRARFLRDVMQDIQKRYLRSVTHTLHVNWYELAFHGLPDNFWPNMKVKPVW